MSVEVRECYLHCGAALRRAQLWGLTTWPERSTRPTAGRIYAENSGLGEGAAPKIDAELEQYYADGVWEVGGSSEE
ncbi:MAG: hypothetical protein ACFCVK_09040 [Acidimicrobiales bacterium]